MLLDDPRNIHLDNTNPQRTKERPEPTLVNYSISQVSTAGVCSCVLRLSLRTTKVDHLSCECVGPLVPTIEQERTRDMLRAFVRRLKIIYLSCAAYEHHRLANRAADQLRMHSTKTLKDIGITRGTVSAAAHHKCPWCSDQVWQEWIK